MSTHSFQAEVKQLLDIVIHSLYTDKEIFLRELISNASDASEKLRHIQLTEKNIQDADLPLEINVSADEKENTITIQDAGIGMTDEELKTYLGTIAHSGSKAFLEAIKKGGSKNENLIGQFGVGFYSAFMVAKEVKVYSRSWKPDAKTYCWTSDGSGSFTIEEAPDQPRGTKIVIFLNDENKDFAQKYRITSIIKRYSSFVPFPIIFDGEKLNKVDALWLRNKKDITDEEYKEFYKFQANAFDEPQFWLHFNSDAPIEIHALLYTPKENVERMGFGRMESAVALYCRKVLIDSQPKGLLPEWLRFLKGVVDSADLPLNISRETMQDSQLVQKLNRVLTKRYLKQLEEIAQNKADDYKTFWENFAIFIKEGVVTDHTHREQLAKLLRYETSMTDNGETIGLADYIARMKSEQKAIYYLSGSSREIAENSPYLEALKARGLEVLFLYDPADEFVMQHLSEFEGKKLVAAESKDIELDDIEQKGETLDATALDKLKAWISEKLGSRIATVDTGKRLVDSPAAVIVDDNGLTPQMRRMLKAMGQDKADDKEKLQFEINARHPLIKNLSRLSDEQPETATLLLEQIFENSRLAAGLVEDPREMVKRNYELLEKLSS